LYCCCTAVVLLLYCWCTAVVLLTHVHRVKTSNYSLVPTA
jgi:hypothetical protein